MILSLPVLIILGLLIGALVAYFTRRTSGALISGAVAGAFVGLIIWAIATLI